MLHGGTICEETRYKRGGVKKVHCSKLVFVLYVIDDTKVDQTSIFFVFVSMLVMQCTLMKWC
jgi:hypothetical protein